MGYWREIGAKDLVISAWADGTSAAAVRGRVRSVEYRMPVDAPMCPKETRVQSMWHVLVLDGTVVLESASMSLDVPMGTSFNTVVCDTFTIEGGSLRMVRSCAFEWVQSSWMKSLVEKTAQPELQKVGKKVASMVVRWARTAAIGSQSPRRRSKQQLALTPSLASSSSQRPRPSLT